MSANFTNPLDGHLVQPGSIMLAGSPVLFRKPYIYNEKAILVTTNPFDQRFHWNHYKGKTAIPDDRQVRR